jgi:hypothetical protein
MKRKKQPTNPPESGVTETLSMGNYYYLESVFQPSKPAPTAKDKKPKPRKGGGGKKAS